MATVIMPQAGPQEAFLSSPADIVIFGGSAGCGKTFAELMDPLRYIKIRGFNCTIFRKNANQITQAGGLWDESMELYTKVKGATPSIAEREWRFKDAGGSTISKVTFRHIERDVEVHSYQGGQICALFFDELTHFSSYTFFYMLSRNRSTCGVMPYVRATTNPDPDSWVREFIDWWIGEDGFPIKERSGVLRYMVRINGSIIWGDSKEELWEKCDLETEDERTKVKSVTFIPALLSDNPALLQKDPGYRANLEALPEVERQQLLYGNWNAKNSAGKVFRRSQAPMIQVEPTDIVQVCRAWDIAATEKKKASDDPDYTAGVLMGKRKDGSFVVLDVINQRVNASEVERLIVNTAIADKAKYKFKYKIRLPQDPGGAGKIVANTYVKALAGYSVTALPVTGSKENRATPLAAQWQVGNVYVMAGDWNDAYFRQLESFPDGSHDDMVDASSDSFNELATSQFNIRALT